MPMVIRVLGQATVVFCMVFALALIPAVVDGFRGLAYTNGFCGPGGRASDCDGGWLGLALAKLRLQDNLSRTCLCLWWP